MLEEFRVENFLSWVDLRFQPRDENLLIGVNNSGKTNLCKALQFLALTASLPVNECAQFLGIPIYGITNFSYRKPTIDFFVCVSLPFEDDEAKYQYSLVLSVPTSPEPSATIQVHSEKLTVVAKGFENVTLLENTRDGVRLLHETNYLLGQGSEYVMTSAPPDTTMLHRLYDLETNKMANHFKRYLLSWTYYDFSSTELRKPSYKPNEFWLRADGGNLASVIHRLKKTDEKSYRRLVEHVQKIEPDIDYINFSGGDMEPNVFMYFAHASGDNIPAWTASSGTLRFLAMAYILLVQPLPPLAGRPLVIIEEPENSLYVGLLKELIELPSESPHALQLLYTSHSPYFIDLFDSKLDSVFVLNKDKHRSTVSNIDVEKAKKHLTDYPLGDQHFREMLV